MLRTMYKLIGADGKEYGPASAEYVRQWIQQGRANAATLIQGEGQTGWQPLGTLTEFASVLAQPVAPPPLAVPAEAQTAQDLLARDYDLDIISCFGRGWELVKRHLWLTVAPASLALVLQLLVEFIPLLGWMLTTVFAMVLWGGVDWLVLKLARGQPASFGDMFAGFTRALVPLLILSVITMVLVPMGLILCLAPGLYLMAIWMLFPVLLIMDKGMDFWPAMELSRKVVHKHFWPVFAFLMLSFVVFLGGLLLLGVGIFLTTGLTTAATIYAYEDIFGERPAEATEGA